jgi:hypothetical protein
MSAKSGQSGLSVIKRAWLTLEEPVLARKLLEPFLRCFHVAGVCLAADTVRRAGGGDPPAVPCGRGFLGLGSGSSGCRPGSAWAAAPRPAVPVVPGRWLFWKPARLSLGGGFSGRGLAQPGRRLLWPWPGSAWTAASLAVARLSLGGSLSGRSPDRHGRSGLRQQVPAFRPAVWTRSREGGAN